MQRHLRCGCCFAPAFAFHMIVCITQCHCGHHRDKVLKAQRPTTLRAMHLRVEVPLDACRMFEMKQHMVTAQLLPYYHPVQSTPEHVPASPQLCRCCAMSLI